MLKAKSKAKRVQTLAQLLSSNADALKTSHALRLSIKTPLPDFTEKPLMGITTEKDYITSNAVTVILSPAKACKEVQELYVKKPDFGKIPEYICKIKHEVRKEREAAEKLNLEHEAAKNANRRLIVEDERLSILSGLKAKWGHVNKEYQLMTHMTVLDTIGKLRRKEQFECDLVQMEKDIALLERPEEIYIDLEH